MMRPIGDGTGGDLAHIWLLPAEEQVDEPPVKMVAAARASDARHPRPLMLGRVSREEEKRMLDMLVSLLAE